MQCSLGLPIKLAWSSSLTLHWSKVLFKRNSKTRIQATATKVSTLLLLLFAKVIPSFCNKKYHIAGKCIEIGKQRVPQGNWCKCYQSTSSTVQKRLCLGKFFCRKGNQIIKLGRITKKHIMGWFCRNKQPASILRQFVQHAEGISQTECSESALLNTFNIIQPKENQYSLQLNQVNVLYV